MAVDFADLIDACSDKRRRVNSFGIAYLSDIKSNWARGEKGERMQGKEKREKERERTRDSDRETKREQTSEVNEGEGDY